MTDMEQMMKWREEPLHPDLLPWVEEHEFFGKALKHPLVFDIGLALPGLANQQYLHKREVLPKALKEKNWNSYIYMHERPYRFQALMDIRDAASDNEFWPCVGDVWIDSENIWQHLDEWQDLWSESTGSQRELTMSDDDVKRLYFMEDRLRVFRGCIKDTNEDGLSWTLDLTRAEWFARRFKREAEEAAVVWAEVDKAEVFAYYNNRGENEVVIPLDAESLRVIKYVEV